MNEQAPRFLSPMEMGISSSKNPELPAVTRDKRGRILWKLPGNTPEQNEQLGIRNVQALFLAKFPEFNDLFLREEDGKISEEKREEAKQFVLKKLGNQKKLRFTISQSINSKDTPYFPSAIVALHKSFFPWGLNIDPQADGSQKPKGYWTSENIEREARNFYEQEGRLTVYVLDKKGRSDLLTAITGKYPGGIYELRAKLGLAEPRKRRGYFNEATIERDALVFHKKEGNISARILTKRKESSLLSAISRTYPGGMRALKEKLEIKPGNRNWDIATIEKAARKFLLENGTLGTLGEIDSGLLAAISKYYPGKVRGLREKLGLTTYRRNYWTQEKIESEAESFIKQHGNLADDLLRDNGRGDLKSAIQKYYPGKLTGLKKRLGLPFQMHNPRVIKKVDSHQEQGRRWVSANSFSRLRLPESVLKRALGKSSHTEKVSESGNVVILYEEAVVIEEINKLLSLPRVDRKSGKYIDAEGEEWVAAKSFEDEPGILSKKQRDLARNASIEGFTRSGTISKLYKKSEVVKILRDQGYLKEIKDPFDIPRYKDGRVKWSVVLKKTKKEIMVIIEFEAKSFIATGRRLTYKDLQNAGMQKFADAITKVYPKSFHGLRQELEKPLQGGSDVIPTEDSQIVRRGSGNIAWRLPGNTSEQDEEMGIRNIQGLFLEKFPEFDQMFARGEDGKIPEEKREEARVFILGKIDKVDKFYEIFGSSPVAKHAAPYFKGSYGLVIQKSFVPWGIHIDKVGRRNPNHRLQHRKPGYWTPEVVEEQAMEIYKREGRLSQALLLELGRHDLLGAIATHYPGRLTALKKKLGVTESDAENISPDQANEELMKLLEEKNE